MAGSRRVACQPAAAGKTDEIIAALSRISGLFVIACNSSFAYEARRSMCAG